MNKKLVFGVVAVVLGGLMIYNLSSGPSQTSETGDEASGETTSKSEGGFFSKVTSILPGGGDSKESISEVREGNPHVVIIKPSNVKADVEDVIEGIESRAENKNAVEGNEAIDYARWAVFSPQYTGEEREKIFDRSIEILGPEGVQLARDVVYSQRAPDLYEKALQYAAKDLNQKELEEMIRDVLPRTTNPALKSQLVDFAATRNIYVR